METSRISKKAFILRALTILIFGFSPAFAFASFVPGQTLDPQCFPSDSTCIVVPPPTNIAGYFSATSTTATSTFVGSASFATSSGNVVIGNPNNFIPSLDGAAYGNPMGLLTVNGLTSSAATLIGGFAAEKTFNIFFPNDVVNQKVRLYWPVGARAEGLFRVTLSGGFYDGASLGGLEKDFGIYGRTSGAIAVQTTSVPLAVGNTPSFYSISNLTWDSTLGAWYIVISNNSGVANDVVVDVHSLTPYGEVTNPGADLLTLGAVYTTDTSVIPLLNPYVLTSYSVGTTTANAKLSVWGPDTSASTVAFNIVNSASTTLFHVTDAGNVGIGTSSPTAQLSTTGTVRFSNFGAGTLTTDASGNLAVSSDERLKNIDGQFTRSLSDLKKLNPISYHWNTLSGLDTINSYTGFSAQNVQSAIPEAVGTSSNGFLTLQDRPILATVVNAIKDIGSITGDFKSALIAWLGSGDNGLSKVRADQLCAGNTCVTEAQLQQLLQANGQQNGGGIGSTPTAPDDNASSSETLVSSSTPIQ